MFLSRSGLIRSGPSSMIQLIDHQENDACMFFIYFNTVIGSLIDILQYVIISHLKNVFLGSDFSLNFFLALPSSRVSALLSVSDLCAPPLQPLVLQPKDKGNLSEWFRSAWSDGEKKASFFFQTKFLPSFLVISYICNWLSAPSLFQTKKPPKFPLFIVKSSCF